MAFGYRKIFLKAVCFLLVFSNVLQAGWNQDFEEQTNVLIQNLERLENSDYVRHYKYFLKARNFLLTDPALRKMIDHTAVDKKRMVEKEGRGLFIKKRENNRIHDAYAWEMSYLLNAEEFVVPAFPIEIFGKKMIVQKIESFECGCKPTGRHCSKNTVEKVSLESYWKAHFAAFLLGFDDLAAKNIGVNSKGKIRFFDNEDSFIYCNVPHKNRLSCTPGFLSEAYDWPQYRQPLDKRTARILNDFVSSLSDFEGLLDIYLQCRPIKLRRENLLYRLEKVRTFPLCEGMSFRDFLSWLYPKMSQGLDELNQIVSSIYDREVDHGGSLFFVWRHMHSYKLTSKEREKIHRWIDRYIES